MYVLLTVAAFETKRDAWGPFETEAAAWDWADQHHVDARVQVLPVQGPAAPEKRPRTAAR